jgi:hypothetical protein
MRMTRTILLLGAAGLILSLAAGCEARQNTRGNLPTKDQVALITPGVHGREDVRTVLGAPSVVSTFDENIWYYIGRRTTQYAFFKRNVLEQQVLIRPRTGPAGTALRQYRPLRRRRGRSIEGGGMAGKSGAVSPIAFPRHYS